MKYTFEVGPWGAECKVGVIPDKIWKYIEEECDGEASTYREKLDDGEVPDEFKLAEDIGSFYETAEGIEDIYSNYTAYNDADIVVRDDELNEVFKSNIDDLAFSGEKIIRPPEGKHFFIWRSVEKATWIQGEFEADEFDEEKLKASVDVVMQGNDILTGYVNSIEYDGTVFEADADSTRGIAYELDFY